MFESLAELAAAGLLRELKVSRRDGKFIEAEGGRFLDFGSNDYLGMSARRDFQEEFMDSLRGVGAFLFGSGGSRLLTGNHEDYEAAEADIARAYGRPCLVFNGGYHANTGLIPAIAGPGDLVLCDKLAHASVIDALRLCGAKWMRFAHNDLAHLRALLSDMRGNFGRALIVTESVFSMDGDRADLPELVKIKNEFDALLYVDEAHGFGVFGARGLGLAEACGCVPDVDFIMCTLGKALAGEGAFVVCSEEWRGLFVNRARSLIFTTALPPVNLRWIRFAFGKLMGMRAERARLEELAKLFRAGLAGFEALGDTQIAPVVVGGSDAALALSRALAGAGIWAPAVRWPTVPANSARIRFSLSAAMDPGDAAYCAQKISETK